MIGIIDYNMGNLGSIEKAFNRLNIQATIINDVDKLKRVDKLILPGVGNFNLGIENLKKLEISPLLNEMVINNKVPILGICLGMQLMCNFSEEGDKNGLGWIDANVLKFHINDKGIKIPHMGWNTVSVVNDNKLTVQTDVSEFYFVHSYYVKCNDLSDIMCETIYGTKFVSFFNKENIFGVQFHPEKSHSQGLDLLNKFAVDV